MYKAPTNNVLMTSVYRLFGSSILCYRVKLERVYCCARLCAALSGREGSTNRSFQSKQK